MSTVPPNLLRFLPTLTEVVHRSGPPGPVEAVMAGGAAIDFEPIVRRVLQRVEEIAAPRIHAAIAPLIEAHLAALMPQITPQIEQIVRAAVLEATAAALLPTLRQN